MHDKCCNCARLADTGVSNIVILLGHHKDFKSDDGFDSILLYAKYFIYRCKINKVKPLFRVFLQDLKYRYTVEECMYKLDMREDVFFIKKWMMYTTMLP